MLKWLRRPTVIRLLSAAVLGPAVVWILWAGELSFAALVGCSAMLCTWEWCKLAIWRQHRPIARVMGVLVLVAVILGVLEMFPAAWAALAIAAVVSAGVAAVYKAYPGRALTGVMYIGAPHVAALWLRSHPDGQTLVMCTVLIVWACDGAAYFVGRALKGPKLAPVISPNKTWTGAIGGTIAALAAGYASVFVFHRPMPMLLIGAFVIAVSAQLGDLFESALKRQFKAKDTGGLIPGHGGLLDRIDGLMAALLVVALAAAVYPNIWRVVE